MKTHKQEMLALINGHQITPEELHALMQEHSDEVSAIRNETHHQLAEALSNIFRDKDIPKSLILKSLKHFESDLDIGVNEAYDQQQMQQEEARKLHEQQQMQLEEAIELHKQEEQGKIQLEEGVVIEDDAPEEVENIIDSVDAEVSRIRLEVLQKLQKATTEALNLATWEAIRTGSLSTRQAASELGISHASIPKRTAEIRQRFSPDV